MEWVLRRDGDVDTSRIGTKAFQLLLLVANLVGHTFSVRKISGDEQGRYVVWWGGEEGMGNWRYSLAELVDYAEVSNRTLILPCVRNGRVMSNCDKDTLPMSDYVNIDKLNRPSPGGKFLGPFVVEFSEFLTWPTSAAILANTTRCYAGSPHHTKDTPRYCKTLLHQHVPVGHIGRIGQTDVRDFVRRSNNEQVVVLAMYRQGMLTRKFGDAGKR
jgi:hypothetical protein